MKLVKLNCPNCNSPLEVDENQTRTKCKYCNASIAIDDETIKIKHTVYSGEKEEEFKNANALLKLGEYDSAYEAYLELSEKYVYESEVWYSLILCLSHEYKLLETDEEIAIILWCDNYIDKYKKLESNEDLKNKRFKKYETYKEQLNNKYLAKLEEEKKESEAAAQDAIKFYKMLGIIILFTITAAVISAIVSTILEERDKIKNDGIKIDSYFNNTPESRYELSVIHQNQTLCYHFTITSDKTDEQYEIEFIKYTNNKIIETEKFNEQFKSDSGGYICYNSDKDYLLEKGEHKIELYAIKNHEKLKVDEKTIKVIE